MVSINCDSHVGTMAEGGDATRLSTNKIMKRQDMEDDDSLLDEIFYRHRRRYMLTVDSTQFHEDVY